MSRTRSARAGTAPRPFPSAAAAAFQTTLDLFETGLELMRQNLKRRHPEAGEEEIDRRLEAWLRDRRA